VIERVLIDTTFLLPLFGIETEKFTKKDFEQLLGFETEFFYNPISLVEIKWVILKITSRDKRKNKYFREIYNETLDYLMSSDELKPTVLLNKEISELEDKLFDYGINDYFDRVIVATARVTTKILLTEDMKLVRQIRGIREFRNFRTLNWKQFKQQTSR